MFRKLATTSLATLVLGAAALTAATVTSPGSAQAYEGRYERGYERPHGWRPTPPAFHGYWGERRWRRYHDGYGFRAPPRHPSPYGYGWR